MKLRKYLWTLAVAALPMAACSDDDNFDPFAAAPEPPIPDIAPGEIVIKPKAMWIDVEANFEFLSKSANIIRTLDNLQKYGYNLIYLDVKPSNGYALYKSDFLKPCDVFGLKTVTRDYDDYLGLFLEEGAKRGIDVVASVGAMGGGTRYGEGKGDIQGILTDDFAKWKDMIQVRNDDKDPTGRVLVRCDEDPAQTGAMLDPARPEVQDLLIRICGEIVTKYHNVPNFKGISLDYCRYTNNINGWYGMSDFNLQGYAEYWNEPVPNRKEILVGGAPGVKFAKWIEYRSAVVTSLIHRVKETIKAIDPECELHLWASADWHNRYGVGQNWASKNYKPTGWQYTDTYNRTGFADDLDVFVTGAYAEYVWAKDTESDWNIENFVRPFGMNPNSHGGWSHYIMGDCKCYGSIAAYALDEEGMEDATYLCLKYTDGYMNFELSHVMHNSLWIASQRGIQRYEGTLDEEDE